MTNGTHNTGQGPQGAPASSEKATIWGLCRVIHALLTCVLISLRNVFASQANYPTESLSNHLIIDLRKRESKGIWKQTVKRGEAEVAAR